MKNKKVSLITTDMRHCFKCGTTQNIHIHHVMHGCHRKNADRYGLIVPLCAKHHNASNEGVHFDHAFDEELKRYAQTKFELIYGHEEWMRVFGRNYL